MSVVETDRTSALLSKPSASASSGGRRDSMSTSSPSRSCTALRYSKRFRRCTVIGRPRRGRASAARSSSVSSQSTQATRAASSGRRAAGGGIIPLRTFRSTSSQSSAWAPTSSKSSPCSEIGTAPRSNPRSLWQATQYRSTKAPGGAAPGGDWAWLACGVRHSAAASPAPAATVNGLDMVTTLPSSRARRPAPRKRPAHGHARSRREPMISGVSVGAAREAPRTARGRP